MIKTKKIKILKNTCCAGTDVFTGNVINAPEGDANLLIAMKKAEPTDEKVTGAVRPKKTAPSSGDKG